jgi:hypothetical protein
MDPVLRAGLIAIVCGLALVAFVCGLWIWCWPR